MGIAKIVKWLIDSYFKSCHVLIVPWPHGFAAERFCPPGVHCHHPIWHLVCLPLTVGESLYHAAEMH
eukprot:747425-Hanusia_phi.AAC.1